MASIEELRSARIAKIEKLQKAGMNPYPASVPRDYSITEVKNSFDTLAPASDTKSISIAGRVMIIRGQGKILFVVLQDGKDRLQAVLKKDVIPEDVFSLFFDTVDNGDFISVTGSLFVTERGEQSILIKEWQMGTKALLQLPDKWGGLQDDDERYRKRYLDILMDPELHELFEKKSVFWAAARDFMIREGFMEIETPTLEITTGGAEARPFKTYHNDYDIPVFLRISVGELWQKRALAAGFSKVFEIGRIYRNEGSSPEHLQEFTNIECYAAYMDYRSGMEMLERMWKEVIQKTFGTLEFEVKGFSIDFGGDKWSSIEYVPYVEEKTGINVLKASDKEIESALKKLGVEYEGATRERMIDSLWKYCRKTIGGPTWLIHHPKITSPLSKSCSDNKDTVERCQLIVAGSEFANSFSELNDPVDQRERFEEQQKLIERGDDEAMMPDWEFVEMLEHGMPPAFGSAPLGERLFAVLSGKSIRETTLFPLMKPKDIDKPKKKEAMVAVAVLNTGAALLPWQELNTIAHLNAAFGARVGKDLFTKDYITSKDNKKIKLNIKNAIMIKKATNVETLRNLVTEAKVSGLEVDEFIREMIETTNDKKITEITASKNFDEIEYLGVLIYGPKSEVEKLTSNLEKY